MHDFQAANSTAHSVLLSILDAILESIQRFIFQNSWLTLWMGLSLVCFLIAIGFTFLPAFVRPVGVVENPEYNKSVLIALLIGATSTSFLLTLPVLQQVSRVHGTLLIPFYWGIGIMGVFVCVFFLSFIAMLGVIQKLPRFLRLARTSGRYLRSLHCQNCRQKLDKLDSARFLTQQERVASRIGSLYFETWHCRNCYPAVNRSSILLYRDVTKSDRFKQCKNCNEITMTITSYKTLKPATVSFEGMCEEVYTCQCCTETEKQVRQIPRLSDDDCVD